MKNKLLCIFIFLGSFTIYSQVGIGTPTPNSSSQLEVVATNRGVLIPRINLTSSTDASTITGGNVNSLLIFNTATISDIKPGYYYWFDNKWNRIVVSGDTAVPAGSVIYNSVNQTFSYIDNSGNSQIIDFSTIVKANETITTQIQNTTTGAITYTNEVGNWTTSQVVSANGGNLLKVGSDGGAMLDVSSIPVGSTTVSNASNVNTSTVTVNGITSAGAPIVNSNETSLSGTSLTTTVNGVASTALDLSPILASGTTNNLSLSGNILTSNVNGVSSTSDAVSGVSNASNANTSTVTVNGITSSGAPIVNSNETSLSGTSLTTTVNGISSTALDLAPAISASQTITDLVQAPTTGVITYTNESGTNQTANVTSTDAGNILTVGTDGGSLLTPASLSDATSVSNSSTGNTATVTVNGQTSTGAPIVNLNETSLSGTSLTTTVNGVSSTALDLSPILASGTTNNLSLSGNTLTSNVNGVFSTSDAVSGVSNASNVNTSTVTVNGITSSGAPIVNSNETSLSGTSLTTTVNGVSSTALDLAPAISASQTITDLVQTASTGVITYTNESGTNQTANVTSTDAGNILTVGTDGGSLLTPASLSDATSVSNSSTGNTATVTVNGQTSTGAPIVNSNTLIASNGNLVSTVNGVATTPAVSVLITANNGLTATNGNVQLEGSLIKPTTIATDAANTLAISGLQSSVLGTDVVVVADNTGVLKTKTLASLNANNWNLLGNAATDPLTNFLGTTDDVDLIFRRNSIQAGKVEATNTSFGVNSFNDYSPGLYNVAIGTAALFENSTGSNNTAVGYNALTTSRTGNNNASLGSSAGSLNTQGSQNTFIGTNSNPTGGVFINNATAIGYNSTVAASNSLVLGAIGADAVKVGIGTDSPENALHVKPRVTLDPVRFEGLQPSVSGTDLIVVADNTGVLRTVTPSSLVPTTSVSNTSSINALTTTVNSVTGLPVNIINSNTLSATNGNLVSTINGVATTPAVPVLVSANNGLTATNGNVQLGGTLIQPTTINTNSNNFAITNLPAGVPSDRLVAIDPTSGILKTVTQAMWSTIGNAGTTPGTNFLGTTDSQYLMFKVNNNKAGMIGLPVSGASGGSYNTTLGYLALNNWNGTSINGMDNTAIGTQALAAGGIYNDNTAVGYGALLKSVSSANTAVGSQAMATYTSSVAAAGWNTAMGYLAMAGISPSSSNTGAYNAAYGSSALHDNSTGSANVAIGFNALTSNLTGSYNIAIGYGAGSTSTAGSGTGSYNISSGGGGSGILATTSSANASNEMNIGNTLFGTGVNNTIASALGKIGINTNAPTAVLDVNGAARVRTLPAGAPTDNIVTADANGNLRTVSQTSSIAATMNIVRNTADYTVDPATDNVILIDAASNNVTVTVPSGVAVGRVFIIKRVDSFAANTVTITFEGASAAVNETDTTISVDIKTAYQIITAGGDKWQTISKFQ